MSVGNALRTGAEALGIALDSGQEAKLVQYLHLIGKWNRVYNLTAVRDVESMVPHHLLDSLAVLPYLTGESLADVGSGPGLPGIPIAVAQAYRSVVMIEANHKKAAFLRQAAIELELRNVQVVQSRADTYRERRFDVVISRAFAELRAFVEAAGHLTEDAGVLLAMKGVYPSEEVTKLPGDWTVRSSKVLAIPGLNAQRHLLELTRT